MPMQTLFFLFRNYFNDIRITDERLRVFTLDHLQRLEQNNANGTLTLLITDTKAAFDQYYGYREGGHSVNPEELAGASLEEIIWQFKAAVTAKEAAIRSVFRKGTPGYSRFYPRGLAEYIKATRQTVGPLMERFAHEAACHEQQLGAGFGTVFSSLRHTFTAANQAESTHALTLVASTYRREHLEQQLCRNLHYIAYLFGTDVEKCFELIGKSVLKLKFKDEAEVFSGVIFFGATINVISMGITSGTVFKVRNTGKVPLRCCLADSADATCDTNYRDVAPTEEAIFTASELGDPAINRFFNITNLSEDIGRYEVLMEE